MLLVRVKTLFTHLLILLVTAAPLFSQNKEYEDTTVKESNKHTDNDQDAIIYELEKELKVEGLDGWYYSITVCRIHDYYYHKDNSNFDCEKVNLYVDKYIKSGDILKHKDQTVVDYTILITAQFLNGKCKNYNKQLEYLDILHQALKNKKPNIRKYPSIFNVLFMMHESYLGLRDYIKALDVILILAEEQNEILGENSFEYLISLNKLAGTYSELGDYNKALETNIIEATKRKEIQGVNHPEYLMCLKNLAKVYSKLGDYQNAFKILSEVSERQKKLLGENHPVYLKTLVNLAQTYAYIGKYETALDININVVEKQKKQLGENHLDYLMNLNNLANIYSQKGDYPKALEILLKISENQKNLLGENHSSYLTTLNNLCLTYYDLGDYKKSLEIAINLAKKGKELWGENHPDYLMVLNNIALNYTELKDYEEALKIDTEIVDKRKRLLGQNHPDYLVSLINLAITEFNVGQLDSSSVHYSEYYNRTKHRIITFFSSLPESQRRHFLDKHSFSFEYVPFFLGQNKPKYSGEIYNSALFIKGLLLNTTREFDELIQEKGSSEIIAKYDNLKTIKLQAQKIQEQPIKERYQILDSLQNIIQNKETELVKLSTEYGEYTNNLKISWKDVQQKLKENEVAIEFIEYPTLNDTIKYAALLLRKNWAAPKMISLCNKEELQYWLKDKPDNMYSNGSTGKKIKQLIWNPLEEYIKKDEKVYFSASGLLYKIAIENIAINDTITLGNSYSLYRLSSTKELVTHKKKQD